jgi:hypothetical protein
MLSDLRRKGGEAVAAATARRNTNSNLLMQGQGIDQIGALGGVGVGVGVGDLPGESEEYRGRGSEEKKKDGELVVSNGHEGGGGGQGMEQWLSSGLQSLAQLVPAASDQFISVCVSPPKVLSEWEKEEEREKKREGRRREKEIDRARERVEIRDAVLFDISKPPVIARDSTPLKVPLPPCLCCLSYSSTDFLINILMIIDITPIAHYFLYLYLYLPLHVTTSTTTSITTSI